MIVGRGYHTRPECDFQYRIFVSYARPAKRVCDIPLPAGRAGRTGELPRCVETCALALHQLFSLLGSKTRRKSLTAKRRRGYAQASLRRLPPVRVAKKLNPRPPGRRSEDRKDGKLMRNIYSQITAEWVGVTGARALALCSDRLQSTRLAAPFTHMQKNTITDP